MSIREPHQESGEPIPPEQEASQPSEGTPGLPPSIPQIPPTPANPKDAEDCRKDGTPLWKKASDIVMPLATVVLLVINLFLWHTTDKSAEAAKEAAKTAADTLHKTVEHFRTDERAWIEIETVKPRIIPFQYEVFIRNVGKTVARDIVLKRLTMMDGNTGAMKARAIQRAQDTMLVEKSEIPALPMPTSLAPNTAPMIPFRIGGAAPNAGYFQHMLGRIDYNDVFGVPHWIKFCFVIIDSNGNVQYCETGNEEDRNLEIQPSNP